MLTRFGFAPPETIEIGRVAGPIALYFALLTSAGAVNLRGDRKRVAEISQRFAQDNQIARLIAGVQRPRQCICSSIQQDSISWTMLPRPCPKSASLQC